METGSLSEFVEVAVHAGCRIVTVQAEGKCNMCRARDRMGMLVATYRSPRYFDNSSRARSDDDLRQSLELRIGIKTRPEPRLADPTWGRSIAA
jgi:hypothetical protein